MIKVKLMFVVNSIVIICNSNLGYLIGMKSVEESEIWSNSMVKI